MSKVDVPFSKKVEMSLLFGQSLEIQTLYYQSFQDDSFNPLKYYLLPKNWIDKYKHIFNYNLFKPNINDYSDYNSFKFKILTDNATEAKISDSSNLNNDEIPPIEKHFIKNHNCQIEYPLDFFPVREEVFKHLKFIPNEYLCELIIGNNNIFVIDNKSKKNIFVCSIDFDKEELDDFLVNVNYIIIYENPNIFKKEMKNHISKKGFGKYCKEKNLNLNLNELQDIKDKEDKIGIFLPINNNNNETPNGFIIQYYLQEIENINISGNTLNAINLNQSSVKTNINFLNLSIGQLRKKYQNTLPNNNLNQENIEDNNTIQKNNTQNNNNQNNYNNIIDNDVKPFYFNDNNQNSKEFTNNINNPINNIVNRMNLDNNENNNLNQNYNYNSRGGHNNIFDQGQYINQNNSHKLKNVILSFQGEIYYKLKTNVIQKSYFDCNDNDSNYYNNMTFNNNRNHIENHIEHFDNNIEYNNEQNNFINFPNNQNYYNNNNYMDNNINNINYYNGNNNRNKNNIIYNNMNQNNNIRFTENNNINYMNNNMFEGNNHFGESDVTNNPNSQSSKFW